MNRRSARAVLPVILIGLVAGLLSGFFGIGGGVVVVPALMLIGCDQRLAAGTSAAAILPTAVVGTVGYALAGDVSWISGIALAIGVVVGAQVGTFVLARLPKDVLFWSFLVFLVLTAVSLWVSVPDRDGEIALDAGSIAGLIGLGVVVGLLSGILGVGGGIIAVPALMFFFGAGDLLAKGTSLLMMIPGSLSATVGNARRRNVDLRTALWIGLTACVVSPAGILLANVVDPMVSNVAFAVLVVAVGAQLVIRRTSRPA